MEPARNEIRSLYQALSRAILEKDIDGILALVTDDFTKVNLDGNPYSLQLWKDGLVRQADAVDYQDAHCQIDKLTFQGEEAVVYLTKRFSGTKRDGAKFHSTVQSRDLVRRKGSEWRIAVSDTFTLEKLEHETENTSGEETATEAVGMRSWRSNGEPLVVKELAVTKALEQMNGSPI